MSIDAQLHEAVAGGDLATASHLDDWWRNRTSDELRDFISRGFAGGELFAGATAEAARRSDEAERAAEVEAAAESMLRRSKTRKLLILRILVGLSLLATLCATVVVILHLGE
jgi:hypothetical protein